MGPKKVMKATKAKKSALQYKQWPHEEADALGEELSNEEDEVLDQRLYGPSGVIAVTPSTVSSSDGAGTGSVAPPPPLPDGSFEIFVQMKSDEKFKVVVQGSNTIDNLKGQIQAKTMHDPSNILLMKDGQLVDDHKTLSMWRIMPGTTLHCLTRREFEAEEDERYGLS
jgi:hypothetical protein